MPKLHQHGIACMRVQPLHNGHVTMINKMIEECETVTILVGSSQERNTKKNPFSFHFRKKLLRNVFNTGIIVLPINDINNMTLWPTHVLGTVGLILGGNKLNIPIPTQYYAGSEEDAQLFLDIGFPTTVFGRNELTGTKVREMFTTDEWKQHVPEVNHQLIQNYLERHNELV